MSFKFEACASLKDETAPVSTTIDIIDYVTGIGKYIHNFWVR